MMRHFFCFLPLVLLALVAPQCRAQSETRLYLIRHAEKAVDGTDDPDLSPEGFARAQKIADMFADAKVTRLYATDWKRTRNTLGPLSKQLGIEIKLYDWKDAVSVEAMLADCMGEEAVICGHSDSTPWLANLMLQSEEYEQLPDDKYDRLFNLLLVDGQLQEITTTDY
jgi:phosphohistidine phosphatase SixA